MIGYVVQRLVVAAFLLWLILSAAFLGIQLIPGDVMETRIDPNVTPEQQERQRAIYGLDRAWHEQYAAWLSAVVLHWDWGLSVIYQRPVVQVLGAFLPPTLLLAFGVVLFQYPIGVTLGILAARRQNSLLDHLIRVGSLVFYSMPLFWLALMMIIVFSYVWPLFPPSNMASPNAGALSAPGRWLDVLHHLVLPSVTLGVAFSGGVARFVRNCLLEALGQDYIRTARARGLSEARVAWVHGLRNAAAPLIQNLGISLPALLSGVLVVEVVFSWPGLGQSTLRAVQAQDQYLVLATTTFVGAMVILGNLCADLAHAFVDPRIRRSS